MSLFGLMPDFLLKMFESDRRFVSAVVHDSTLAALNAILFGRRFLQPDFADFVVFEVHFGGEVVVRQRNRGSWSVEVVKYEEMRANLAKYGIDWGVCSEVPM